MDSLYLPLKLQHLDEIQPRKSYPIGGHDIFVFLLILLDIKRIPVTFELLEVAIFWFGR